MNKFRGTGVAMVTPFKNGEVDFDSYGKLIEHVIAGDVNYLVPLGSTGETATLNETEARTILDFVIKTNNGRKPIVAGNFGDNNTKELVKKIKGYNFDGISAILSSSPAYIKPSQEGIFQHYAAMADASPVPIILYNVPGRTRSNMEWYTTVRLANHSDKFIGIKEASADLIQATRIIKNAPEGFFVTSGDDEVAMPMIACGGQGVISVMANAFPAEFSGMITAALEDRYADARSLNMKLYDLHHWLYLEGNPVGIKSAMQVLGIGTNDVRLPLANMSKENYKKLEEIVNHIKNS